MLSFVVQSERIFGFEISIREQACHHGGEQVLGLQTAARSSN